MARHRKDAPKPGRTVLEKRQAKQRYRKEDRFSFQECSITYANSASVGSVYALAMRSV